MSGSPAVRSVAALVAVVLLSGLAGCRIWDVKRDQLERIAQGERFVEAYSGLDPQHHMIFVREDDAVVLRDAQGNEIRSLPPAQIKEKDLRRASAATITRWDEHRTGIVVGSVLGAGAAVGAIILGLVLGGVM